MRKARTPNHLSVSKQKSKVAPEPWATAQREQSDYARRANIDSPQHDDAAAAERSLNAFGEIVGKRAADGGEAAISKLPCSSPVLAGGDWSRAVAQLAPGNVSCRAAEKIANRFLIIRLEW